MSDAQRSSHCQSKERRDMMASFAGGVFTLVIVFLYLQDPLFNQSVKHPLALLMGDLARSGTIPFNVMETPAFVLFLAGIFIEAVVLITLAVLLIWMVRIYTRGDFFTVTSARIATAMSWVAFAYGAGPYFELLGANMLAHQLNIGHWFEVNNTTGMGFGIWYMLLLILSMMSVMLRRAARMQEDQEGLI